MITRLRVLLLLLTTMPLGAASAHAQAPPETAWSRIASRVQAGNTIVATLGTGERVRGDVVSLDGAGLIVQQRHQMRRIDGWSVDRIERRTRDSVLDGALFGAAAGAGLFLAYYSRNALCEVNCGFASGAMALVAIGAGVGLGVDTLRSSTEPIDVRRAAGGSAVLLGAGPQHVRMMLRVPF